jgi:hypothetical protein
MGARQAHQPLKLPRRSEIWCVLSRAIPLQLLRLDDQLHGHPMWGMRFCSKAHKKAYQRRLAEVTRAKIRHLVHLPHRS